MGYLVLTARIWNNFCVIYETTTFAFVKMLSFISKEKNKFLRKNALFGQL